MSIIGKGQITITDVTDIVRSNTAPNHPVLDQMWLDTSQTPNIFQRYDGSKWVIVNDATPKINALQGTVNTMETALNQAKADITRLETDIATVSSDGHLTMAEKLQVSRDLAQINGEHQKLIDEATACGVDSADYAKKYDDLKKYLTPIVTDTNSVTNIEKDVFITNFENYDNAKITLINAMLEKSRKLAADATTAAGAASSALSSIRTELDLTNLNITTLTKTISDILSDGKLTAIEKQMLKKELDVIVNEKSSYIQQAIPVNVSTADYEAKHTALVNLLNHYLVPANMGKEETVDKAAVETAITNYNNSKVELIKNINITLKRLTDNAVAKIDSIQIGGKNLLRGTRYFTLDTNNVNGFKDITNGKLVITTEGEYGVATISNSGLTGEAWARLSSNQLGLQENDIVTISMYVKVADISKWDRKTIASLDIYSGNDRHAFDIVDDTDHVIKENNKWYYITKTFTINVANVTRSNLNLYLAKNGTISFRQCKLELGNKATDWTPAIEDIEVDVKNTQTHLSTVEHNLTVAQTDIANLTKEVSDLGSDGKLTPSEKIELKREVDNIKAEQVLLVKECVDSGNLDHSAYDKTVQDILDFISNNKLLVDADMSKTSDVDGNALNNVIVKYGEAKLKLQSDLTTHARINALNALEAVSYKDSRNILRNFSRYRDSFRYTITATKDDHTVITVGRVSLEQGKTYTFSCRTDGTWGNQAGTDTVEVFLLKDGGSSQYVRMASSKFAFLCNITGEYYLRLDVNKNGTTHSFWDVKVELGDNPNPTYNINMDDLNAELSLLNNYADDGKLTPIEKRDVAREWKVIFDTNEDLKTTATSEGVSVAALSSAYTTLYGIVNPLVTGAALNQTSDINRENFKSAFYNYYIERQKALNAIDKAQKTVIDKTTADLLAANTNLTALKRELDDAKRTSDAINAKVIELVSDNIITPNEKIDLKMTYEQIKAEKTIYDNQASTNNISSAEYDLAFGKLQTILDEILDSANMDKNYVFPTGKDISSLITPLKNYNNQKIVLIGLMTDKAKEIANAAQEAVNLKESRNLIRGTKEFLLDATRLKGFMGSATITKDGNYGVATITQTGLTADNNNGLTSSDFEAKKGDIFTVSFYVKVANIANWTNKNIGSINFYGSSTTALETAIFDGSQLIKANNVWYKFVYKHTVANDGVVKGDIKLSLQRNGSISFKMAKVEKGDNSYPEYSANPEDLEETVQTLHTDFTVSQGQIQGLISDTTIGGDKIKDVVSRHTQSLTTIENELATQNTTIDTVKGTVTSVSNSYNTLKSDLDSTKSTVTTITQSVSALQTSMTSAQSSITQMKSDINLRVTEQQVQAAIVPISESIANNLQTRNFVFMSNETLEATRGNAAKVFNLTMVDLVPFKNKSVTVSVDVDLANVVGATNGRVGFSLNVIHTDNSTTKVEVWKSLSTTATNYKAREGNVVTIPNKDIRSIGSCQLLIENVTSGTAKVSRPKLEIGTNQQPLWSAAPEDNLEVATKLQAAIDVQKDRITHEVSRTDTNVQDIATVKHTADGLVTTVSGHSTLLGTLGTKIQTNIDKTNTIETTVDGTKQTVSSMQTTMNSLGTTVATHTTEINALSDEIKLKVASADFNKFKTDNSAEINVVKNSITQKVREEVDGIQIGGSNLIKGSDFTLTRPATGDATKIFDTTISNLSDLRNREVTISVFMEIANGVGTNARAGVELSIMYADNTQQWIGAWNNVPANGTLNVRGRVSGHGKTYDKEVKGIGLGAYIQRFTEGTVQVSRPKLEFGTKATDWDLSVDDISAPMADLQHRVSEAETKITPDAIINTVSNVYTKKDVTTALDSKVTQLANSVTTQIHSVTQEVSGAKQDITNTQTRIDNLKVGGRNLLLYSAMETGNLGGENGAEITYPNFYRTKFINVEPSTNYLIRMNKPHTNEKVEKVIEFGANNNFIKTTYVNGLYRSFVTDANTHKVRIVFTPMPDGLNLVSIVKNYEIKFEKGIIFTDWSPAPEDVELGVDGKIESLKVGGRNLIVNSEWKWGFYALGTGVISSDGIQNGSLDGYMVKKIPVKAGDDFRFTVYRTTQENPAYTGEIRMEALFWDKNNAYVTGQDSFLGGHNASDLPVTMNIHVHQDGFMALSHTGWTVYPAKLEMGNVATDWTPSQEDSDAKLYEESPHEKEITIIDNSIVGTRDNLNSLIAIEGRTVQNLSNKINVSETTGQYYGLQPTICETSILKLNTDYTLIYDLNISASTSSEYKVSQIGITNTLNSIENHPILGDSTVTDVGINTMGHTRVVWRLRFTDFKGLKYLGIRPLRRNTAPVNGQTVTYTANNFILVEGNWTNEKINGYFEGIKHFEATKFKSIGKNLYKPWLQTTGANGLTFSIVDGDLYVNGTATDTVDFRPMINDSHIAELYNYVNYIMPNGTTVSLSNNLGLSNYFSVVINGTPNYPINSYTKKGTETDIACFVRFPKGGSYNNKLVQIQIEIGNQATSYEEYNEYTNSHTPALQLGRWDKMDYKGNITRGMDKYTFTGNEQWQLASEITGDVYCAYCTIGSMKVESFKLICDKLPSLDYHNYTNTEGIMQNGDTAIVLAIKKSKLSSSDVNGIKAWLKANPTTIWYKIANPTTEIATPISLATFNPITNYFNDSIVPASKESVLYATTAQQNAYISTIIYSALNDKFASLRSELEQTKQEAENAKTEAESAKNSIRDIIDDSKLTPNEKQELKRTQDIIIAEHGKIIAEADRHSVPRGAYDNAFNALNTYLTDNLKDLNATTGITPNDFKSKFEAYYNAKTDVLNAITSALKTEAANIDGKVNNIQIGGRNLWIRSTSVSGWVDSSHGGNITAGSAGDRASDFIKIDKNSHYIFQLWGNAANSTAHHAVIFGYYDSNKAFISSSDVDQGTGDYYKRETDNIPSNAAYMRISARYLDTCICKFEKGNKATDWTPAPEDLDAKVEAIKIGGRNLYNGSKDFSGNWINSEKWTVGETVDGFTARTRTGDYQGLYQTFNAEIGEEFILSGWIKSTTSAKLFVYCDSNLTMETSSFQNGAIVPNAWVRYWAVFKCVTKKENSWIRFENHEPTNMSIYGLQLEKGNRLTDWSYSIKDIDNIADIQIGGNNLLLNAGFTYTNPLEHWSTNYSAASVVDSDVAVSKKAVQFVADSQGHGIYQSFPDGSFKAGEFYTISGKARCTTRNSAALTVSLEGSGVVNISKMDLPTQNTWYNFVVSGKLEKDTHVAIFYPTDMNGHPSTTFQLCNLKLEHGAVKTDWTPAPQDIDNQFSNVKNDIGAMNAKLVATEAELTKAKADIAAAKAEADSANAKIADIVNDNKLTPNEKQDIKREMDVIDSEFTKITTEAGKHAVSVTDYTAKHTHLHDYITPLLANLTTTDNITATDFRTKFKEYYDSRQDILNAITAKIKTEADALATKINNIQIGGRNLLKGTREFELNTGAVIDSNKYNGFTVRYTQQPSTGFIDINYPNVMEFEPNTEYTLSYFAKSEVEGMTIRNFLYPDAIVSGTNSSGHSTTAADGEISQTISTSWKRYWVTWKTKPNISGVKNLLVSRMQQGDNTNAIGKKVYMCACKLEKGNKATDWTPAPEDAESGIANLNANLTAVTTRVHDVEQKVTDTAIINSVKGYVTTQLGSYVTESTFTTKTTQLESDIKNELTQTVGAATSGSVVNHFSHFYGDINVIPSQALHTQIEIYRHTSVPGNNTRWSSNGFAIKFLTAPLIPVKIQLPCVTMDGTWNFDCKKMITPIGNSVNIKIGGHGTVHTETQSGAAPTDVRLQGDVKAVAGSSGEYKYIEIEFPSASINNIYYFGDVMVYSGTKKADGFVMNSLDIGNTMDKLITDSSPTGLKETFEHIVNENGDVKTIETANFNMTRDGLVIKNASFKVLDRNNTEIAAINQDNWMKVQGLEIHGAGECFRNVGRESRSLVLESTTSVDEDYKTPATQHITFKGADLHAGNEYNARIERVSTQDWLRMRCNGLEIQSFADGEGRLEIRSGNNDGGHLCYLDFCTNSTDDYTTRLINYKGEKTLHCEGKFVVSDGSKSAVVDTENYGRRLLYCEESTEIWFTDYCEGEIGESGSIEIHLDPVFVETIDLTQKYHVFHSCYEGSITRVVRNYDSFVVYGEVGTEFSCRIQAKRLHYATERLEQGSEKVRIDKKRNRIIE